MEASPPSIRDVLLQEHRVLERLADALDRSRLRAPGPMRELCASALDVLAGALEAHEDLETAAMADGAGPRAASWEKARRTAELQHDGIASLIKDMRIIVSDPARYRASHLASLAYLLSRSLREHVSHEERELFPGLSALDRPAGEPVRAALRRVEVMLEKV